MKVIGIGDNVCDKYEHLKMMFPGGQAMNFAVYAFLSCGSITEEEATAFLLSFTESMEREPEKMANDRAFYEEELKKALAAGAEFASRTCMVQRAFGHGKSFE